jgi:hypothetical protein
MPKLPATLPARPKKDLSAVNSREVAAASKAPAPPIVIDATRHTPALPGMTVRRDDLARFMRFAALVATRSAMPSLRCVRFGHEVVAATDLDVWLSAELPGARDIGVLVPTVVLKQFLRGSSQPDVSIERYPSTPSSPYKLSIDGAVFSGHDPREFADIESLFRRPGERRRVLAYRACNST